MAYQVGQNYNSVLGKKNAVGIWVNKYVMLSGTNLSVADSEGGAATQTIDVGNVLRGGATNDPLIIVVCTHGTNPVERTEFKAADEAKAVEWVTLLRQAMAAAGRQRARNTDLPAADPRHGLRFYDVPANCQAKFQNLLTAVLYFWSPVKKYGAKSFVGRHSTEDRVAFVTDKCLFVTKPDSEVTRCMKIGMMTALYTNIDVQDRGGAEIFIVVKMASPDYDLYMALPEVAVLVNVLGTLFKHLTKGRQLPVHQVKTPGDSSVNMQLSRPRDLEMMVIKPLQKAALKKALDEFAQKEGIVFTKSGRVARRRGDSTAAGGGAAAAAGGSRGAGGAAAPRRVDPIDRFLAGCGLPQYATALKSQNVDLDVLECMDDDDIRNFGVSDAAHRQQIKAKLQDADFLEQCKRAQSSAATAEPATNAAAAAGGAGGGGGGGGGGDLDLDLDDDLDLDFTPAGAGGGAAGQAMISLDSDDDLLDIAPAASGGGGGMRLSLDSDSDLDLAPSASGAQQLAISLDSDDDI